MVYPPQGLWTPPRTATLVVAAYNASDKSKVQADFVCDGIADEVEIQAAIDAVWALGGGTVKPSEGDFYPAGRITLHSRVDVIGSAGTKVHSWDHGEIFTEPTPRLFSLDADAANWVVESGTIALADSAAQYTEGVGALRAVVAVGGEISRTFAAEDWSYFEFFHIFVWSTNDYVEITFKVQDADGNYDRWHFETQRPDGWNEFTLPLRNPDDSNGVVDYTRIVTITIDDLVAGDTYYFDDIRVVKGYGGLENLDIVGTTAVIAGTTITTSASEVYFKNLRLINIADECFTITYARRLTIDGCLLSGLWGAVALGEGGPRLELFSTYRCRFITIINNKIVGVPQEGVILTGNDILFKNNQILNAGTIAVRVRSDIGNTTYRSSDIRILNNTIRNAVIGVSIRAEAGGGATHCLIEDNDIGNLQFDGVDVETNGHRILNNKVRNVRVGISLRAGADDIRASGNFVEDSTTGINIESDDNIAKENYIKDCTTGINITATAERNVFKDNRFDTVTNPIVDAGVDSIFDLAIEAVVLDLSGGATDLVTFHAVGGHYLCGYTVLYTEASSADAGVNIRIGRLQADGTFDDDYYDIVASEINEAKGYSTRYKTADLLQMAIADGESVTVGTVGGKTGAGEVKIILHIAKL